MSTDVVYVSDVQVERIKGPLRRVTIPAEDDPIYFSVHSEIAEHYGVDNKVIEPHVTTLDMVVASTAAWLTGTLGGALEARGIPAGEGLLKSEARGDIGKDGNVYERVRNSSELTLVASPEVKKEKGYRYLE